MDFCIGNTPLRQLNGFSGVFAKLEMENPTGSAKDRAALFMVEDAVKRGLLAPGGTILEPTSGNTGIALAAIASQRGYRAIIVMPDTMSVERQQIMASYGAQVILTPGAEGVAASMDKAQELAKSIPGSFIPGQFDNPANAQAHFCTTGPEIWQQMEENVDIFVCTVGTGGTLTGTGRYLKAQNPALTIVAVEPAGSPVLSGGTPGPHGLQGIGAGFIPKVLDTSLIDRVVTVMEEAAFAAARRLRDTDGILAGISSGAALAAAEQIAKENPGKRIITILPDTGERYRSSGLFDA